MSNDNTRGANGVPHLPPQGNQQIALTRLSPDSEVGLIGMGLKGVPVVQDGKAKMQVWVMIALGEPSIIPGGGFVCEIPWKPIDMIPAEVLIEKFNEAKKAAFAQSPLVVVP